MTQIKQDFFDRNLKHLSSQRAKVYLFDIIYLLNSLALPVHLIKKRGVQLWDVKVNMGCGASYLEGWINVDGNPFRRKDLWLDLRRKWPFRDGAVRALVAAHVIEHLFDEELDHFFREARRVMKVGSFLHLEVPSLELLVSQYPNCDGTYFNEKALWHGAHRQLFDYKRLQSLLSKHNFGDFTHYIGVKGSAYLNRLELNTVCLRPQESLIVEVLRKQ